MAWDKKISQLTQGTPLDSDVIPYVDWVTLETKKALKSELKWDTWDAATLDVWTTTTWAEWTDAIVANSGTTSAAIFDFTIPRWDTGATGATWATWDTWPQWDQWIQGVQWDQWIQGIPWISGWVWTDWVFAYDYHTATASQTLFNLTISYTSWENNLYIYVNWNKQVPDIDYTETSDTSVTFTTWLTLNDKVEFINPNKWLNWQWTYAWGTAYAVDDAVSYNGSSYMCKLVSTWNLPTNTTYWDLLASKWDTWDTGATWAQGIPWVVQTIVWWTNITVDSTDTANPIVNLDALTTDDVTEATDKNYVTDAESVVIGNTSGTNTWDQDLSWYVESDPSWVTWADQITNTMSLTQAEYDAIWTPDASTLYNITDSLWFTITTWTVTSTSSQTLFTVWTYVIWASNLEVYVNWIWQVITTDYTETSTTSITFTSWLTTWDVVKWRILS